LLKNLFGDDWNYPVGERAVESNHEYDYLLCVIEDVQQALSRPIIQPVDSKTLNP